MLHRAARATAQERDGDRRQCHPVAGHAGVRASGGELAHREDGDEAGEPQMRGGDVERDRLEREHAPQTCGWPVVALFEALCTSRRAGSNLRAVDQDRNRANPVDAADRGRYLRDAEADKAVETYDFAGSRLDVQVVVFPVPPQ